MSIPSRPAAILLLADGTVFHGQSVGAFGITTGEMAFNTGMTGYQEIYTDPSYFGQIIVNTHPHIGNYGVHALESESGRPKIAGLVVKRFSNIASRKDKADTLQHYLETHGIVGIEGIDTRALVRHIRRNGAQNGLISTETNDIEALQYQLAACPDMSGLELSSKVTTSEVYDCGELNGIYKVAALDFGIKQNILRCLAARLCHVRVFPANTPFETLAAWNPDGYFLSNGPGDPSAMPYAIETVKKVVGSGKPVFGICLGHQLLSLSLGIPTYKMFNGHRGINHPVKNLITGKSEITSQNHGFAVSMEAAMKHPEVEVTHINLNDQTVEGIRLKGRPVFSVQHHPESSPGPHDSRYLFDDFVASMSAVPAP